MSAVESRLAELGYTLPQVAPPIAAYVPAVRAGQFVFTSGQLPTLDGALVAVGKVGSDIDAETAQAAARQCALNALAAVKSVIGDLDRIVRVVKVTGFIAVDPAFTSHSIVMNGASDLLSACLGDAGVHARSSVGMASLPLDAPVEVELVVEVRD